uniref:Uncharacterized protein n=1 Tax=viral metagenome TaxID=1070528 RepID=A0A6C0CRC7_9ZZZZ
MNETQLHAYLNEERRRKKQYHLNNLKDYYTHLSNSPRHPASFFASSTKGYFHAKPQASHTSLRKRMVHQAVKSRHRRSNHGIDTPIDMMSRSHISRHRGQPSRHRLRPTQHDYILTKKRRAQHKQFQEIAKQHLLKQKRKSIHPHRRNEEEDDLSSYFNSMTLN